MRRQLAVLTRLSKPARKRPAGGIVKLTVKKRVAPRDLGLWAPGLAVGLAGARRFRLYRPPGIQPGERLPLMVMLHGCSQDAETFAACTRMNSLARQERFLVLYPEQDRLAHAQGCWNWYGIDNGRASAEVASILQAIDHVLRLHPVDEAQVAIAGFSAGACMAALLAERHPERFKALIMHSGVVPGVAHSGLSALAAMRGKGGTPASARPLAAATAAVAAAARGLPLLVMQGDADGVVVSTNGRFAVEAWAHAAGAQPGSSRIVQRGHRHAMTVTDFKRAGATLATLVAITGLAHAWSGGAGKQPFSDPRGPDASRLAWAFAVRQFRAMNVAPGQGPSRQKPPAPRARVPPFAA